MTDALDLPLKIVTRLFPPGQIEAVAAELVSSCAAAPPAEQKRAQLAVLKLYTEDPEHRLETWLRAAQVDYRDVLFWAESPGQARARNRPPITSRELKALRASDRTQLAAWLRSVA